MQDNLFLGKVSQRMIVDSWIVRPSTGTRKKYPFAFQKKGITSVRQFIEGEEYP